MQNLEKGKASVCLIMSILCITTVARTVAYSAVTNIFPPQMTLHHLTPVYSSIVIAAYAFA